MRTWASEVREAPKQLQHRDFAALRTKVTQRCPPISSPPAGASLSGAPAGSGGAQPAHCYFISHFVPQVSFPNAHAGPCPPRAMMHTLMAQGEGPLIVRLILRPPLLFFRPFRSRACLRVSNL